MNTWSRRALLAAGFSLTVTSAAFAALSDVDPGPYTFATGGFPMWYKDSLDQSPELCQSRAVSSRAAGAPGTPAYMCTLLPEPGIYDDTLPLVFPDNWPPEMFWFWPRPPSRPWATAAMNWKFTSLAWKQPLPPKTRWMETNRASPASVSACRCPLPVPTPSPTPMA